MLASSRQPSGRPLPYAFRFIPGQLGPATLRMAAGCAAICVPAGKVGPSFRLLRNGGPLLRPCLVRV